MRYSYSAHMLLPDGSYSAAAFTSSVSEITAARVALRASNTLHCNTCVVCRDSCKNTEVIVQRITYHGEPNHVAS